MSPLSSKTSTHEHAIHPVSLPLHLYQQTNMPTGHHDHLETRPPAARKASPLDPQGRIRDNTAKPGVAMGSYICRLLTEGLCVCIASYLHSVLTADYQASKQH